MLIECPECKRQVSNSAEVCPGCGYRLLGRQNLVLCPRCNVQVIPQVLPNQWRKCCPLCSRPVGPMPVRFFAFLALLVIAMIALPIVVAVVAMSNSGPTQTYTVEMSESGFGSHGAAVLTTTVQARSASDAGSMAQEMHPGWHVVRVHRGVASGSSPGKAAASTRSEVDATTNMPRLYRFSPGKAAASTRSGPARPSTATAKEVPRGRGER